MCGEPQAPASYHPHTHIQVVWTVNKVFRCVSKRHHLLSSLRQIVPPKKGWLRMSYTAVASVTSAFPWLHTYVFIYRREELILWSHMAMTMEKTCKTNQDRLKKEHFKAVRPKLRKVVRKFKSLLKNFLTSQIKKCYVQLFKLKKKMCSAFLKIHSSCHFYVFLSLCKPHSLPLSSPEPFEDKGFHKVFQ